jgi:hypothetical protein
MKTTSFHISLVAGVKLSGRSGGFKVNVWREAGQKRYEFEAENEKQASKWSMGWHEWGWDWWFSWNSFFDSGIVSWEDLFIEIELIWQDEGISRW